MSGKTRVHLVRLSAGGRLHLVTEETIVPRNWLLTLDAYANAVYGRNVSSAVASGTCVSCGTDAHPFGNRTAAAAAYPRVGLCERCYGAERPTEHRVLPFRRKTEEEQQDC